MADTVIFDFVKRQVLLVSPTGDVRPAPPVLELVGSASAPPAQPEG